MSPPPLIAQLELILRQLVIEHRGLLAALEAHEFALRSCAVEKIERAARDQDAARQKIANVESRRRQIAHQLTRQHRSLKTMTVAMLVDHYPDRKANLLAIRAELADLAAKVQEKTSLTARVAQTVLGHVNATLRLVTVAAGGASTYTARGDTAMPMRIGRLNAVA